MKKLHLLTSLLHMTAMCLCAPSEVTRKHSNTTYDQRQVGKYNIHFNIKDVAIIALSSDDIIDHIGDTDSYADYYDYEDSEYTVSPIIADLSGRPTKKPNVTDPILPSIAGLNLSSITPSTDSPHSATSKKPETVVVIHEKPPQENDTKNNVHIESSSISYQANEIPVQVIVEPVLKPKIRPSLQSMKRKVANRQVTDRTENDDDQVRVRPRRAEMLERRAERIRARRAQGKISRNGNNNGCGRGETNDGQGGCRRRRSGMSGVLEFLTRFLPQRDSE